MNVKKIISTAGICALAALILIFPSQTAESVVNSINVCIESIIPSMFAFMVISSYIQGSGKYKTIFKPVLFLLRKIIRADDSILSIFLLSLVGGYPAGVKLLKETIAQNKNSPAIAKTAEYASSFCYCISPSFAMIMIGSGVFGDPRAGTIIYLSDVIACIVTAAAVSRFAKLHTPEISDAPSGYSLTDAINSSSRSLFTICTIIAAFNILLTCVKCALSYVGIVLPASVLGIFEISNLLNISEPSLIYIPVTAAISSMGGICVLLQSAALVNGSFNIKKFIIARLPCAAISAAVSWIILQFTDISVSASTISNGYTYGFSANKLIVPVLTAMCIIIFNRSDKILKKV